MEAIRAARAGSQAPPDEELAPAAAESAPNHYCLEPGHASQLVTAARRFYADPEESGGVNHLGQPTGAPICPVCSAQAGMPKRVSAVALADPQDYPAGFVPLAARIQQQNLESELGVTDPELINLARRR